MCMVLYPVNPFARNGVMSTIGRGQRGAEKRVTKELGLIVARGESLSILVLESSNVLMAILPNDTFEFVPHVMLSSVCTEVMP